MVIMEERICGITYRITLEFLGRLGRGVRKGTSRSQNGDSFVKEGERNN